MGILSQSSENPEGFVGYRGRPIISNILAELDGTPDGEGLLHMLENPTSFGPGFVLQAMREAYTAGEIRTKPPVDSSAVTKWRVNHGIA